MTKCTRGISEQGCRVFTRSSSHVTVRTTFQHTVLCIICLATAKLNPGCLGFVCTSPRFSLSPARKERRPFSCRSASGWKVQSSRRGQRKYLVLPFAKANCFTWPWRPLREVDTVGLFCSPEMLSACAAMRDRSTQTSFRKRSARLFGWCLRKTPLAVAASRQAEWSAGNVCTVAGGS